MTETDRSGDRTVQPTLTEEQAEALLTYTETSLAADDNFDEYNLRLEAACQELKRVLEESDSP